MRTLLTAAALAALTFVSNEALGQGPVRQGLRRTGEIAVEGTRRVADGTGRIIQGTGQAAAGVARGVGETTAGVARGVGETAADVVRGTGQAAVGIAGATASGIGRLTPDLPLQARAGANLQAGDAARDARWRFARHNNEWWYYSPENRWMYHRDAQWNEFSEDSFAPTNQQLGADESQPHEGEHSVGYRGADPAHPGAHADLHSSGAGHANLHVDSHGREYICENGRRVYVASHAGGEEHSVGYRGEHGDQSPTPAIPSEPQPAAEEGAPTPAAAPAADAGGAVEAQGNANARQNANAGDTSAPQAPREVNNNPDTAREGDASTSGSANGDTLR